MTALTSRENLLRLYPALAPMPPARLDALLAPAALMRVPAHTQMFAETQTCRGFPLILEGSIKVVKTSATGRELLLYRVEPGESCIITSSCLLGRTPYTARGETETAVTLAFLEAGQFNELVATLPAFRDFVFHLFSDRIADLMELVEEVAFHRLDQRLARLLLAKGDTILATHQALAEELGSVREIVSRLLKGFASQGMLALGRERVEIINRKRLQAFADAL